MSKLKLVFLANRENCYNFSYIPMTVNKNLVKRGARNETFELETSISAIQGF